MFNITSYICYNQNLQDPPSDSYYSPIYIYGSVQDQQIIRLTSAVKI